MLLGRRVGCDGVFVYCFFLLLLFVVLARASLNTSVVVELTVVVSTWSTDETTTADDGVDVAGIAVEL